MRRIIVPTTCCTRLAPRAGDLLLHRSFSSIYLHRHGQEEQSDIDIPLQDIKRSERKQNQKQMKTSGERKHNEKLFRSLARRNIWWQRCAVVKLASCLLCFYIQSVQSALNAMNNQICEKRARRRRETRREKRRFCASGRRRFCLHLMTGFHLENFHSKFCYKSSVACNLSALPGPWAAKCSVQNEECIQRRRRRVSAESGQNLAVSSQLFSLSVS